MLSNMPAIPPRFWSKWCASLRGLETVYSGRVSSLRPRASDGGLSRTFKTFSYSFAWLSCSFSVAVMYSSR